MNKRILKKEISNILEALHEQAEIILSHEGRIPQIEMDIAMGNIRKLYEDFYLLDKENRHEEPAIKRDDLPSADEKKEAASGKAETQEIKTEKAAEDIHPVEKEPLKESGKKTRNS
ncbi:MAG: hypothetical protein U5Q03_12920 [Bacteroidota bacterium]|nr:hypothetical protein [Bacteroidota bacterium]